MSDVRTFPIYLVRHADAGAPSGGDLRALSERGQAEAQGLVGSLADRPLAAILASPLRRCLETVAPIAAARGLPVRSEPSLGEGGPLAAMRHLVEGLREPSLVCSHGDLIPGLLDAWRREGLAIDGGFACQKASLWCVEMAEGAPVTAVYHAPARG